MYSLCAVLVYKLFCFSIHVPFGKQLHIISEQGVQNEYSVYQFKPLMYNN